VIEIAKKGIHVASQGNNRAHRAVAFFSSLAFGFMYFRNTNTTYQC
jgi:hypothetical protein